MGLRHFFLCVLLLLAAAPASAAASGWSGLGGGAGRSGHDALDPGAGTPVASVWERIASPTGEPVHSGPVVSWGAPGGSRVAYGTESGSFFVQRFGDGAFTGNSGGIQLDNTPIDDTNTFGDANGKVSPVTVSSALNPGQIYILHNDDNQSGPNDLALAQIDASTGALVQDQPLSGTDGFTVQSSPVITEPDADGTAHLLFVAGSGSSTRRLYRVDIADAGSMAASWATPASTSVTNANLRASPALVWLEGTGGVPTEYAALGTSGGTNTVETYAVANFAAGPTASGIGTGQTPVVPLTTDGRLPGSPKSGFATTPVFYVAGESGSIAFVNKIEQSGSSSTLTVATSGGLPGFVAPAMAISRRVGPNETEGVIALTTSDNFYLVESGNLLERDRLVDPGPITGPGLGFGRTTAALSDTYVFVTRDGGEQLVLNTGDAQPVDASEFTESLNNSTSAQSYGGPALAAGRVVFTSDRGTFAYSTIDGTPPRVTMIAPPGSVSGYAKLQAEAYDARGVDVVEFRIDGNPAGTAFAPGEPGSGPSHALPGAVFGLPFDTRGLANGDHLVEAVAADRRGLTARASANLQVANPANPADNDPPETAIEAGPRGRTADTTPRFRFSSSERPEAFECSLDGKSFRSCPTRHVLALVAGRHRLRVRAIDAAGNVDPTPSIRSFTVLAPGLVEVVATRPIELNRRGKVAVPVTCHSRRRCRGLLVVYAIVPRAGAGSVRAAPARKGRNLRVGKRRFSVSARTRRKVLVRVSAAGRRLLRRNGRVKALARVKLNTPAGVERSSWALTLTDKDN